MNIIPVTRVSDVGGKALSDTLGKLTCAPLAGGHTPREGGSLGTGVWRGGSKGGTSHPSPEGLIPQDWGVARREQGGGLTPQFRGISSLGTGE